MNSQATYPSATAALQRVLLACTMLCSLLAVSPVSLAQTADAGPAQTVADTDGLPGESVTLDGSGSLPQDPEQGVINSYVWTNAQGVQIANGETPTVRLPDGANEITLTITEIFVGEGTQVFTDSASVTITVAATAAPVADPGPSRAVADSDGQPGELVTLDASGSTDSDGTIVLYEWFRDANTPLGSSETPVLANVALPDGVNQITLAVTDNVGNVTRTAFTLTIGAAEAADLADLDLNPNERQMANNLDDLCTRLADMSGSEGPALTPDQQDLLDRCNGIIDDPDSGAQETALEQLGAEEMNAMRTQALLFSRTQSEGVMDRLMALRSGASGISVAGLSLRVGGKYVPAAQVVSSLRKLLGGGASSDADDAGGLLDNRLGFWLRGNYGEGDKNASAIDEGFESEQWGFTGGIDYRFSAATVAGLSLGYGKSAVDFKPIGDGNMDTKALTGSLYGSAYLGSFYFDGVINYSDADYDTHRNINYTESGSAISRTAVGSASGDGLSGGLAAGYDFVLGAFTISPSLGYFFVDTNIDRFTEEGAGGLNLAYEDQHYESSTGNAGLRITYAWKTSWGVVIPHLRGTYVREFEDETEVFGVRFAADPFASSSDPTPPIIVQTTEPDQSYFRLAAGLSAQFPYDISGYVEYQRLESFELVDFQDVTIGLRMQHSFR